MSSRKRLSGVVLVVAAILADHAFGWGVSQMLSNYATGVTWTDIQSLPWGGVASVALMLAGILLLVWPTPKTVRLTPQQRARGLASRGENIAARVNNHRHWSSAAMEMRDPLANVISDGGSLLLTFEKEGFAIPNFQGLNENRRTSFAMMAYFSRICPLLRDGHYAEAMGAAAEIAEIAVEEARSVTM